MLELGVDMINKYLPNVKDSLRTLSENGYKNITTIKTKNCYKIAATSSMGKNLTELWDIDSNLHKVMTESITDSTKTRLELLREYLDGTPFDFYAKTTISTPKFERTYLYKAKPSKEIYLRIFDKENGKKEYLKKCGNDPWRSLIPTKKPADITEKPHIGFRIRHEVNEKDGSVSTYLLNPRTQCLYKKNVDKDGNIQFFKVSSDGVLKLFA